MPIPPLLVRIRCLTCVCIPLQQLGADGEPCDGRPCFFGVLCLFSPTRTVKRQQIRVRNAGRTDRNQCGGPVQSVGRHASGKEVSGGTDYYLRTFR